MLTVEERIKSKLDKKIEAFKRKHPQPWYKPFDWVPPKVEKVTTSKGKVKIIVKEHAHFQQNFAPGTKVASGDRIYEVQKTGALKCLNKEPSKRDLHREGVK